MKKRLNESPKGFDSKIYKAAVSHMTLLATGLLKGGHDAKSVLDVLTNMAKTSAKNAHKRVLK